MWLTIAIPTWDRPEQLRNTVKILLPQLEPGVEILVLDNQSKIPAAEVLTDLVTALPPGAVRIVRHRVNVGGNVNIMRCFEWAEGEWVWTLGDDDRPAPDAVSQIFAALHENPSADYFNFCSSLHPTRQAYTAASIDEFLDRCDSISNALFVSVGLWRRRRFTVYLESALYYVHTNMPVLVLLFVALRDRRRLVFTSRFLVGWELPPGGLRWPRHFFFNFVETVSIIPGISAQRKFIRLLAPWDVYHPARELLRWSLLSQLNNPDNPPALYFVGRGAWLRSQLAPNLLERCKWGLTSAVAMVLHRHEALVWKCWSTLHRLKHGKKLERQPTPDAYSGMYFHRRDIESEN